MKNFRGKYSQLFFKTAFCIYGGLLLALPISANEDLSEKGKELNLQISADNNDVVEGSDGSFYLSSFDGALFGHYYWNNGVSMSSFYRWITKDIKQGDTIRSAILTLYLKKNAANNGDGISTKFYGISEDDTPVFSLADRPSLRPITKSNVTKDNWTDNNSVKLATSKSDSTTSVNIDVTKIVQEIIARSGFSKGDAIAIAHVNNNSWDSYGMSHEFSSSPDYAPKLKIIY